MNISLFNRRRALCIGCGEWFPEKKLYDQKRQCVSCLEEHNRLLSQRVTELEQERAVVITAKDPSWTDSLLKIGGIALWAFLIVDTFFPHKKS